MSFLSISGVTKRFGGVVANRDISFEVAPGERIGFDFSLAPDGPPQLTSVRPLAAPAPVSGSTR